MTKKRAGKRKKRFEQTMPSEILMTDLEHLKEGEWRSRGVGEDSHAAGTPGGGSEYGGLAGTNVGDGSPENVDLDDVLGPGDHDFEAEEELTGYAGPSGGAVGGTPANMRSAGGHSHGGVAPGGEHRGDSTIGSQE